MYHIFIFKHKKASDYITGKVIHSTTGSLFPGSGSVVSNSQIIVGGNGGYTELGGSPNATILGGNTSSYSNFDIDELPAVLFNLETSLNAGFSGSIQEYREWMEILDQKTFDLHTLNPTSYVSSLSPTGSYDTLVRHYPLGTDNIAIPLGPDETFITSSHPAYKNR